MHQLGLNFEIEWTLGCQTGCVIHFDQPRLEVCVHHDVKPKDLEAKLVLNILGLTAPVQMPERGLSCYQSLDDHVSDLHLKVCYSLLSCLSTLFPGDVRVDLR